MKTTENRRSENDLPVQLNDISKLKVNDTEKADKRTWKSVLKRSLIFVVIYIENEINFRSETYTLICYTRHTILVTTELFEYIQRWATHFGFKKSK